MGLIMKSIWQRIKWKRIGAVTILSASLFYGFYALANGNNTELIEYRKEVEWGESVWSICESIATDQDDLRKLVWQTCKENHITDARHVDPGTLLIVRVKAARSQ